MNQTIFTELSSLGLLSVAGLGAKKLLQGQLTCNLDEIIEKESRLGAHCNPQGRILSLARVFFFRDQYFLQMPRASIASALSALKKYAVFFKVELTDVSDQFFQIGYRGEVDTLLQSFSHDCFILKIPGEPIRFEVIGDIKNQAIFLEKFTEKSQPIDEKSWKALNILAGIPTIYPETTEQFLPHEINLPALNAVSFNKGCYTGQEIIARMQYRGKLKTHLYHATTTTETSLKYGMEIYTATGATGFIVDFVEVGYNQYELLVIAKENEVGSVPFFLDTENTIRLEIK